MLGHFTRLSLLLAAFGILLAGCGGVTTTTTNTIGQSLGGSSNPTLRFDYAVNGTKALSSTQILIQSANSANQLIHFQIVDVQLVQQGVDANGNPLLVPKNTGTAANPVWVADFSHKAYVSESSDGTVFVPSNTTNAAPVDNNFTNTTAATDLVGTFDAKTFTYTPPAFLSKNPNTGAKLEFFGIYVLPDDPSQRSGVILLHLSAPVAASPTQVTLPINTAAQPNLSKFPISASVPGDHVTAAADLPDVTFTADNNLIANGGSVDKNGVITAPTVQGAYNVHIQSKVQPENTLDVPVTVTQTSGSGFTFQ